MHLQQAQNQVSLEWESQAIPIAEIKCHGFEWILDCAANASLSVQGSAQTRRKIECGMKLKPNLLDCHQLQTLHSRRHVHVGFIEVVCGISAPREVLPNPLVVS